MESMLIRACSTSVFQRCSGRVPAFPERKRQVGYIGLLQYSEIPLEGSGTEYCSTGRVQV